MIAVRKILLLFMILLIALIASPASAEYISIMRTVTYPSAESGAEIVSSILSNAEPLTVADTGGTSEGYEQMMDVKIKEQLNLVTFSSYRNVGDMPITRAILGSANFNLGFWPEVANALADKVPSSEFNEAKIKANKLMDGPIPRAQAVVEHAQEILPGVMYPISIGILSLVFAIQLISTFVSRKTGTTQFFVDIARFMFFFVVIITFRVWVLLALEIFNFCGYLIAPWGGQEEMQKALVAAAKAGGVVDWEWLSSFIIAIMRWVAYMSIKVLLISRDVLLAVSLVIGPICLAMGYLSLYSQNDVVKGFLAGWMQAFFKFQFWGVFAAIAMIGLSIVDFIARSGSADPLVVFITGIAFVHAAYNIPKLADNMSAVVISSVLMATLSMATTRGAGTATSAAGSAAKSGLSKILRR